MEEFQPMDLIKCINEDPLEGNSIAPPVKVGGDYSIFEVLICPSCGSKHLDVGIESAINWITCFECKKELPRGDQIHWCHPSRFVRR